MIDVITAENARIQVDANTALVLENYIVNQLDIDLSIINDAIKSAIEKCQASIVVHKQNAYGLNHCVSKEYLLNTLGSLGYKITARDYDGLEIKW